MNTAAMTKTRIQCPTSTTASSVSKAKMVAMQNANNTHVDAQGSAKMKGTNGNMKRLL